MQFLVLGLLMEILAPFTSLSSPMPFECPTPLSRRDLGSLKPEAAIRLDGKRLQP